MPHQPYTKQYASPADLVAHLINQKLTITNKSYAEAKIDEIGYNRLRIYFLSRRDNNLPGRPFIPGTSFEDIIKIYDLDENLRMMCFRYCAQLEILFRNAISESLSSQHGSHPYFDDSIYHSTTKKSMRHEAVKCLSETYHKKINDQRAKHYFNNYNPPFLPPIWTMKEFMTFGTANFLFEKLSGAEKTKISAVFNVSNFEVFNKWIVAILDLRNICAHHDRLFNRSFQKQPPVYKAASIPNVPQNKLKAILQCLEHMLNARGCTHNVVNDIGTIISRCPSVSPHEAGY